MSRRAVLTAAGAAAAGLVAVTWVRRVVLPRPDDAATVCARPRAATITGRDRRHHRRQPQLGPDVVARPERRAAARPARSPDPAARRRRRHHRGPRRRGVGRRRRGRWRRDTERGGEVALARDVVLVAVPSGTFNHLARDLGLDDVSDAIDAVRAGTAIHMDVGVVDIAGGGVADVRQHPDVRRLHAGRGHSRATATPTRQVAGAARVPRPGASTNGTAAARARW